MHILVGLSWSAVLLDFTLCLCGALRVAEANLRTPSISSFIQLTTLHLDHKGRCTAAQIISHAIIILPRPLRRIGIFWHLCWRVREMCALQEGLHLSLFWGRVSERCLILWLLGWSEVLGYFILIIIVLFIFEDGGHRPCFATLLIASSILELSSLLFHFLEIFQEWGHLVA